MPLSRFDVRRASAGERDVVIELYRASASVMVPALGAQSVSAGCLHVGTLVDRAEQVLLAADARSVAAVLVAERSEIHALYAHPQRMGEGACGALVGEMQRMSDHLELWCFEANLRSRSFYARHGFLPVGTTDGSENDERLPLIRYRWSRTRDPQAGAFFDRAT